MNCAHKYIRQSSELVFMDATSSLDHFSYPTYIISIGQLLGLFFWENLSYQMRLLQQLKA